MPRWRRGIILRFRMASRCFAEAAALDLGFVALVVMMCGIDGVVVVLQSWKEWYLGSLIVGLNVGVLGYGLILARFVS